MRVLSLKRTGRLEVESRRDDHPDAGRGRDHSPFDSPRDGRELHWHRRVSTTFLYGTAAALVFSRLFFPNVDPLVGTLSAFGTFAVGFVARPLGGAIFGHFGDRIGRKAMLIYRSSSWAWRRS